MDPPVVKQRSFRGAVAEANVKRANCQYYTDRKGMVCECVWHLPKKSDKRTEKKDDSVTLTEINDAELIKQLQESHHLIANPDAGLHLDREERKEKELIDRWGMIFTSKERKNQAESARVVSVKKEAQRERAWLDMIESWDKLKAEKLKARARCTRNSQYSQRYGEDWMG